MGGRFRRAREEQMSTHPISPREKGEQERKGERSFHEGLTAGIASGIHGSILSLSRDFQVISAGPPP